MFKITFCFTMVIPALKLLEYIFTAHVTAP